MVVLREMDEEFSTYRNAGLVQLGSKRLICIAVAYNSNSLRMFTTRFSSRQIFRREQFQLMYFYWPVNRLDLKYVVKLSVWHQFHCLFRSVDRKIQFTLKRKLDWIDPNKIFKIRRHTLIYGLFIDFHQQTNSTTSLMAHKSDEVNKNAFVCLFQLDIFRLVLVRWRLFHSI